MSDSVRTALAGAALAGVVVVPGLVAGPAEAAGKPHDVATGTRLAARTNPAVQLIGLDHSAKVLVPTATPKPAFQALFAKAAKHAKAGRIPADQQSQLKWVLRTAGADVKRYLAAGKPFRTVPATTPLGICTGWWVTPDGYMVSAAHCVTTSAADLRRGFAAVTLPKITQGDVRGFLASVMKKAQPDDTLTGLAETMFTTFNTKAMRLSGVRRDLKVISQNGKGVISEKPLRVIAKGAAYPGPDFALLKMPGGRNLPTVPLGRDTDVRVGDYLYISGFPGTIVFNSTFDARSRLVPSVTEGAYNARRTTVRGVQYIQAQAPAYGGNSGGPVFSREGKVIGTLIATGLYPDNGVRAENTSFVLPVSVIRKHLAAAGVVPSLSATSRVYGSALDDFFAARYSASLPKFRKTQTLYPPHPYVGTFIADARKAIAAGRDKTP